MQRIRVEDPLQSRERGVEILLNRRQGHVHDGDVHAHDQQAHAAYGQDQIGVRRSGCAANCCYRIAPGGGACWCLRYWQYVSNQQMRSTRQNFKKFLSRTSLNSQHLHDHSFGPLPIKLRIEHPLPGSQVELPWSPAACFRGAAVVPSGRRRHYPRRSDDACSPAVPAQAPPATC